MLNRIILIGRLAQDPELRYTPTEGVAVATFSLAVERPFANQKGEKEVDFIRIVVWRKQAENCANYLSKGRLVAVEGRLQLRSYEDRDGIKRTIAEVVASNVTFLGGRKDISESGDSATSINDEENFDMQNDDIPF
ncbi:MAG: single-stranded DNA-binding protein [Firmicutes bacterium]|nr:single-stranded DNA-binding protein [Bacillota bacterium]